jgi:type III pantothenate kinase
MAYAALIDIGNSRIKWRLEDLSRPPVAITDDGRTRRDEAWRDDFDSVPLADRDALVERWAALAERPVASALISNVAATAAGDAVERALATTWPGIRVERVVATPVEGTLVNGYAEPARLGADRWMAAVGAHALLPARSLLVCGFGTATTIDLLVADNALHARFIGGLILPGPDAMRHALLSGTARLSDRPGAIVAFADNTDDAIASGIAAAQVGALMLALRDARRRVADAPVNLVIAGGASRSLLQTLESIDTHWYLVPDLVLQGLAVRARTQL